MAKNKITKFITKTNTNLLPFEDSFNVLLTHTKYTRDKGKHEEKINLLNSKLSEISGISSVFTLKDGDFEIIPNEQINFNRRKEKNDIVYTIDVFKNNYSISTYLYAGLINLKSNTVPIEIKPHVSNTLFFRILNFALGIYTVSERSYKGYENDFSSILIKYMFLINLKKTAAVSFPSEYKIVKNRGYDIKGNVDVNEYINNDLLSYDKKISYVNYERKYVQSIIDVLYAATKSCKKNFSNKDLPDVKQLYTFLSENYSGSKVDKKLIQKSLNEKTLQNNLFYLYKKTIQFAKLVLENEGIVPKEISNGNSVSGYLIDVSYLWETYLYHLFKFNFPDFEILTQEKINIFSGTFYARHNYPDFVFKNKNNGNVFVFDAKFKKMTYENKDVDNDDLQQINSYSYFFLRRYGEKFKGGGLIYPAQADEVSNQNIFRSNDINFGVFTLEDVDNNKQNNIIENEKKFIKELREFMNLDI